MVKTELYSAPSPGFLMLLNGTTTTRLLKPKTYISALLPHLLLLQLHPTNIPQIHPLGHPCPKPHVCQELQQQPPNWSPYFCFYQSHPPCTDSQSLLHLATMVTLKTQDHICPSHAQNSPIFVHPTENIVFLHHGPQMWPDPTFGPHLSPLSRSPFISAVLHDFCFSNALATRASPFPGMFFHQIFAWLVPFLNKISAQMILPPKIVPYSNAAVLSLEVLHHMTLTYYLHSTYH